MTRAGDGGRPDGGSANRAGDDGPANGGDDGPANGGDDDRPSDGTGQGDGGGEEGPPARVELVVIAASTLFTVALFGYVLWQAALGTTAVAPEASVVETTELSNGDVQVEVAVANDRNAGLAAVTVTVHCTSPPAQVTFEHVPVDGRRTAFVVCPPGSGPPEVTVTGWRDA